jgi:long-subunit acyl-CoA synthetase (AMP-forming)
MFGGARGVDWPSHARWQVTETVQSLSSHAATPLPAAALATTGTTSDTTVAFLQYTSGSTTAPKGVMITHACLQHNVALIRRALDLRMDDCEGSFLPQYHDMGLVGGYLAVLGVSPPTILLQSAVRHTLTDTGWI